MLAISDHDSLLATRFLLVLKGVQPGGMIPGMAAKFWYMCPKCEDGAFYNSESLERGVCRKCGHHFTSGQIQAIKNGIKCSADERKIVKVLSKLKRK